MESYVQNPLTRVRESLSENNIDTFLVLMDNNRRYLSGYTPKDTPFDESAGALLINETRQILLTDSRFDLQAKKEAPSFEVICYKEGLAKELPGVLKSLGAKKLGFETVRMTVFRYNAIVKELNEQHVDIELVGTENMVEKLRMIKTEPEIENTRKALLIAETVFTDFIHHLRPGMSEKTAAWMIESSLRTSADQISFQPICGSGPNSALPHAVPGDREFRVGEPILFDWGAKVNGYCSDMSRTVILGQPDDMFNKVYQTVHDALRMATEAIKAGVSSKAVDGIARNYIENKGFKDKFGHGLGHGTGLGIHEGPRLSPTVDSVLESGMIVTVEPGIYLPDWGGVRIENMVVVRDDGPEVLNTLNDDNFSHIITI